jgi:hypothetical protein
LDAKYRLKEKDINFSFSININWLFFWGVS